MTRSGYGEDYEYLDLYRTTVANAIRGKRGQAFLRELAKCMDAMPEKVLISEELINDDGACCAIGVVCKFRGIDVSKLNPCESRQVAKAVDIAASMAAEIAFMNDEWSPEETPQRRWERMRKWVDDNLVKE